VRILLVEDEINLAEAVAAGLRSEDFEVTLCHDGAEGLERATSERFDVIVLDILLPGLNGFRVCSGIRSAGIVTPILMLTAKSGEYDIAEALEGGADDYLTKPFSFVVLLARIRALIRRGSAVVGAAYVIGDLRIDPSRRAARRANVDIPLTAREYALLEAIARRNGTIISKSELLEEVWGTSFDGDPNIVEVYVGYLRKKIDLPFGESSLETVRGRGYRLAGGEI